MLVATSPKAVIRKSKKAKFPITTLGITFPFQPSLYDKKFIQTTLTYINKAVATKLKEKFSSDFGESILARLDKTFSKLNYNTQKKSVTILIDPDKETITYLDFFTKPSIYFNKNISLFDLLSNTYSQPEFFLLYSVETKSILFEYYNGKLHKNYETKESGFISSQRLEGKPTRSNRNQQILNVLKLINQKNSKPVFVTGNTQQVNMLYNTLSFQEIMFKKSSTFLNDAEGKLNFLASEINDEWRYWHYEFLARKIELSKKSNQLTSKIGAVSEALKCSKDGILLIDKYYKKQLIKSLRLNPLFKPERIWMKHLERFLTRGNRIEIVKAGLLKNYGGIVLLENEMMNPLDRLLLNINVNPEKNNHILF